MHPGDVTPPFLSLSTLIINDHKLTPRVSDIFALSLYFVVLGLNFDLLYLQTYLIMYPENTDVTRVSITYSMALTHFNFLLSNRKSQSYISP